MSRMIYRPIKSAIAFCIGCSCTDLRACPGGCSWLRVDYEEGKGVCSCCKEFVEQWDRSHSKACP